MKQIDFSQHWNPQAISYLNPQSIKGLIQLQNPTTAAFINQKFNHTYNRELDQ